MKSEKRKGLLRAAGLVSLVFLAMWSLEFGVKRLGAPWHWIVPVVILAGGFYLAWASGFRLRILAGMEFGAAMFLFLAFWVALGTLVIQGETSAFYAERYGFMSRPILALSLDDLFYAGWFQGMLALMGVSLLLTSLRKRTLCFRLIHLGIVVVLVGGLVSDTLGVKGSMKLRVDQPTDEYMTLRRGRPTGVVKRLPFTVNLKSFKVEYYPARPVLVVYRKQRGHFQFLRSVDPKKVRKLDCGDYEIQVVETDSSTVPASNPQPVIMGKLRLLRKGDTGGIDFHLVSNGRPAITPDERFSIGLRTMRNPRKYTSTLGFKGGGSVIEKRVRVNYPVVWEGFTFYLSDYGSEEDPYSGITVKQDPGYPVVLAGLFLMLAGLILAFVRRSR